MQWGEYRDRRKRWHYAEQRSKLTGVDRQKAQKLQQEFCTRCCPICLESFDYGCGHSDVNQERSSLRMEEIASHETEEVSATEKTLLFLPRSITWNVAVDDFGIPRRGADGKKLKMLRCGHIFCETCWKSWVHSSACGSPCQCPVCRQDVGVSCRSRRSSPTVSSPTASLDNVLPTSESTEGRLLVSGVSRPVYDSITESSAPRPENGNIRNFRVSAMLRGSVLFCQPHFTRRADSLGSTVSPTNETIPLLVRPQSCNFESYI